MKKTILFVLVIISLSIFMTSCTKDEALSSNAQDTELTDDANSFQVRTCGSEAHMAALLENPEYRRLHQEKFDRLKTLSNSRAACNSPVLIPVAVHYQGSNSTDRACLVSLAQSQIDILNQDYGGTNSDINKWNNVSSNFPDVNNGEACIKFQLATKNHPSGFGISNGDKAVTINKTSGDQASAWNGYINIFVKPNTGVLGYSPLGGSGNGDGVVVDAQAFGAGSGCGNIKPNAPYNLGRTLTHELGHYLLLDHIWANGCGSDDNVQDTPNQGDPHYGCPSIGVSSCNSKDMFMNYMDYVDDLCMVMFSQGQATRMEGYINSSLQHVISKGASVLDNNGGGGGTTPTCNDGIQNGNETGVDCGGSCTPCQTTPTCNDGIQNGNETGVDCGGSCAPCQTTTCDAPTGISHDVQSTSSVAINWNAAANANKYVVKYRKQGTSQWSTKQSTTTSKTITDLQANTTYQYRLRTKCNSGNSPFSSIATFTTDSNGDGGGTGGSDCTAATFRLTLDDYGSETTWTLKDANNTTIASGGPYEDYQAGKVITKDLCLEDGCYTFKIKDSYGDGICCYEGYGEYEIVGANGTTYVHSYGEFGTVENQDFCIQDGYLQGTAALQKDAKKITTKRKTPFSNN